MTLGVTALTKALGGVTRAADREPLAWVRFLPVQYRYLTSRSSERLLRAGNQVGKTFAALADLYWHATGQHPYRPCASAGEYWIICATWSQSIAVQGKLAEILARGRLHPSSPPFDVKNGFGAKNPTIRIRHESGEWSVIRFKTTRQGALTLSSATIDGALFDEPPISQRIYVEVRKRVMRKGGWIAIAMTPVNAPIEWIKELAESGGIEDIHTTMSAEALTPIGAKEPIRLKDGTLCDDAWIAAEREKTPDYEEPVVIDGEWEMRATRAYFDRFNVHDGGHVHANLPRGEVTVCLGIDHGHRPGKQVAHLVLVTPPSPGSYPRVYVLDSYVDRVGDAVPEDDARGILDMLDRHGMTWASIDHAFGDRIHMPGHEHQKSNRDLGIQIAKLLRVPESRMRPALMTVKRGHGHGAGSVAAGSRWLYHAMVRDGGFAVHPRCEALIDALQKYDIRVDDDAKDPVDALRYALDAFIFGKYKSGSTVVRFR